MPERLQSLLAGKYPYDVEIRAMMARVGEMMRGARL
jgi:hypothetical protein